MGSEYEGIKIQPKKGIRFRFTTLVLIFLILFQGRAQADTITSLSPPVFSHTGGFYSEAFNLVITTDVPGAVIYYTLDGSYPDPDNTGGTTYHYKNTWAQQPGGLPGNLQAGSYRTYAYQRPVPVRNRASDPDKITNIASSFQLPPYYFPASPVYKGTVVRAIAVREGYGSSHAVTHTYFIHPRSRNRYSLPVISLNTNEDHLFDYVRGIYTPGIDFDTWRQNNPDLVANHHRPANYHRRGDEWEYSGNMSFLDIGSVTPDLNQEIGFRLHGMSSRSFPMKSFRIYARSEYGESRLAYPFFPDKDYNEFKRILLRNSGNDWYATLFRDALIHAVCSELNLETQAYRPAVLFLNGEYWGIHNIRERFDRHYLNRVFGIEEDSLDLLTGRSSVVEGDNIHYLETLDFIENYGLQDSAGYEYIQTRIDTENFIDYQIAQIFSANTDWPGNNVDYWRKKTATYEPDTPYGHDGRWRWLLYDMDFGYNIWNWSPPDHNTLEFATQAGLTEWPNPDYSTFLLRSFLQNDSFKYEFISRFADLLNSAFLPDRINNLIDNIKSVLEPEIEEHINRWKTPSSLSTWNGNVNAMRYFADMRNSYQLEHLVNYFDLSGTTTVTVDVSDPKHGYVRINTIEILPSTPGIKNSPYPWTGTYFEGVPVIIEAKAYNGYSFSHWEGRETMSDPVLIFDPADIQYLTAHFIRDETGDLIHCWHFNELPGTDSLIAILSDYSFGTKGEITYFGSGTGYMNWVTEGSDLNLCAETDPGNGLRVRNPSDSRELVFVIPSNGFSNLSLEFAVRRTVNGATNHDYLISSDSGESWTELNQENIIYETWQKVKIDLAEVPEVHDNGGLQFKVVFGGENADALSGNNRFDNISLRGDPLFVPGSFYSKPEGDLSDPATWGDMPDGSGNAPESFDIPATVYYIQNRPVANISENWSVTGSGSKVVLGDGNNPAELTIPPEFNLSGKLDISDQTRLILQNINLPQIGLISPLSTVIFEQNNPVTVPSSLYGNLQVRNNVKNFSGNYTVSGSFHAEDVVLSFGNPSSIILQGDLNYLGNIETRFPENLNIVANGEKDQVFFSDGPNLLDGYNLYIEKTRGGFMMATHLYARNNLRLDFSGEATFNDGSRILRVNDDLRIAGGANNFNLTGTVILSGDNGTNDIEIRNVPLNNLEIDVTGDARPDFNFSGDIISINNLTMKSRSSRPLRLRDKRLNIKGDLTIDMEGPEQIDKGQSFIFLSGQHRQIIRNKGYGDQGLLQNLVINNPSGIGLDEGAVTFDGLIHFEKGIIETSRENLLKLGSNGSASWMSDDSFVSGPMGIYNNTTGLKEMKFPVGKENGFHPVILETDHDTDNGRLYIAEYYNQRPPDFPLPAGLNELVPGTGYFSFDDNAEGSLISAAITLSYKEYGFPAEFLKIAMAENNRWINLGAVFREGMPGMIRSEAGFSGTGLFALGRGINKSAGEVEEKDRIFVYPNPVPMNGTLFLLRNMDIQMVNATGMIILKEMDVNRISLRGISPGVYFLKNQLGEHAKIVVIN